MELSRRDFEKELKELAENCTKLSPTTARKKACSFINKYSELVSRYSGEIEDARNERDEYRERFRTLKNKKVLYQSNNGHSGVILLDEISQIDFSDSGVLIITKNNRSIELGASFGYLKDLFW